MKGLMKRLSVGVGLAVFFATSAFAQSEKITIRMAPEPNQTIRMNMTQEMQMDIVMELIPGLPPGATMPPMKMMSKTVTAMTQKVGLANAQGNVESEIVYDDMRTESTMNGQPLPVNVNKAFVGKRMTVTYDKDGNVATIGGKITMAGGAPAPMPPMTLQGTIRTTITGTN